MSMERRCMERKLWATAFWSNVMCGISKDMNITTDIAKLL
jgi:hypothetical protein